MKKRGSASAAVARLSEQDTHFQTSHLLGDITGRSVRGGAVTLAAQVVKLCLQIASTMVLARLLTPAEFGVIAMVGAFTGLVGLFSDFGLSMATVQRADINHGQVSTFFWINVGLSAVLMLVGFAMAPAIASFYGEPELLSITIATSATFVLGGLSAQHIALLRRQMHFTHLAMIETGAMASGVGLAIVLAWYGAGYWALVAMGAMTALTHMILAWTFSGWRPGLPARDCGIRPMLTFGMNVSGFSVLTYIGRNADAVLIGRVLGASVTGLYSKAYSLMMLPLVQINTPINAVAVPALSRLQNDPQRYRDYYYRALNVIAYLTGPLIVLMAITADHLIILVMGVQWIGAADVFRFLSIAALFQPILYTAGWVWLSMGRASELLRWSMVTAPAFVASFALGLPWGAEGVALSYAICVNVLTPVGLRWAYRGTSLSLTGAVSSVSMPYTLTAIVFALALSLRAVLEGATSLFVVAGTCGGSILLAVGIALLVPAMRRDMFGMIQVLRHFRRA